MRGWAEPGLGCSLVGVMEQPAGKRCRGRWGPLRPAAWVWALDRLPGLRGSGCWGDGHSQAQSQALHPLALPADPAEFPKFSRRRRCCRPGVQLALLGLVTVMLWAGLLTLLLFWREDAPGPRAASLLCPLPGAHFQTLGSPTYPLESNCPITSPTSSPPVPPQARPPHPIQHPCLPPFPHLQAIHPQLTGELWVAGHPGVPGNPASLLFSPQTGTLYRI